MKKLALSIALIALISAGAAANTGNPTTIQHRAKRIVIEVRHHGFPHLIMNPKMTNNIHRQF